MFQAFLNDDKLIQQESLYSGEFPEYRLIFSLNRAAPKYSLTSGTSYNDRGLKNVQFAAPSNISPSTIRTVLCAHFIAFADILH